VSLDEGTRATLLGLADAGVDLIVVGLTAAVALGAPVVTFDLDIVHQRTEENVDRLLGWLLAQHAYHRFDLAKRRLPPTRELLSGSGHINLATDLGPLDVLCELGPGEGYEELLPDSETVELAGRRIHVLGLERLIAVKARANRPKDRAVLPVLLAALDELRRGKG
jgi:hypothetical protein